tara:strand:- start:855 stop:1526 length:672 start_codon:yes stop_codon:yes gene_type:complete
MKKITIALMIIPMFCISQIKMPEILKTTTENKISYEQTLDIEYSSKYKDNTKFNQYLTKDNVLISVGDTLTIGQASIDKSIFNNLYSGDIKSRDLKECKQLNKSYENKQMIIHSIYVTHQEYEGYNTGLWNNKKKTPLNIHILLKPIKDGSLVSNVMMNPKISIFHLEKSFENMEIVNPNPPISRSEAIAKLKEAKDLMELDLLSKEEYNDLRKKLLPIINNN